MSKARILIFDIETSPIIGYTWGVWQTNVIDILEDYQILTVAWKWLGESKTYVIGQDDFKDYKPGKLNDLHVVEKIHELFNEADVIVAHNGNSFDAKKCRARMAIHGMMPPAPYKQIDTKLEAKKLGGFTRNHLKHLASQLQTTEQKGDPGGFETWQGCLAGDKKSWMHMKKYNKKDVTTLEELYLKLLPWMTQHPNMNLLENKIDACPKCGSYHIQSRGYQKSNVATYRRLQCCECGGWFREMIAEKTEKVTYVN